MQQVIEEILKTEEDCAKKLEEQRTLSQKRRAEIDSLNAERVRAVREEEEQAASRKIGEHQQEAHRKAQEQISQARESAERELSANQAVLDRIVDRIVDLVTATDR